MLCAIPKTIPDPSDLIGQGLAENCSALGCLLRSFSVEGKRLEDCELVLYTLPFVTYICCYNSITVRDSKRVSKYIEKTYKGVFDMANKEHKKFHMSVSLIFLYWLTFLLPYSWGAFPIHPIITNEAAEASFTKTSTSGDSSLQNHTNTHLGENRVAYEATKEKFLAAGEFYKSLMHAKTYVRRATFSEHVDLLTVSMWSTMIIMGSIVFGSGFLILSWRVYWSVHEASKEEPVTISFLFSIPGLRYLKNHARYHLFETPLQPRRRFASFVGVGSHKVLLDDLEEEDSSRFHHTFKGIQKRRRDSILRSESKIDGSSSSGSGKPRCKSITMKPSVVNNSSFADFNSEKSSTTASPEHHRRKRHSITLVQQHRNMRSHEDKLAIPITPCASEAPSLTEEHDTSNISKEKPQIIEVSDEKDYPSSIEFASSKGTNNNHRVNIAAPEPKSVNAIMGLELNSDNIKKSLSRCSSIDCKQAGSDSSSINEESLSTRMLTPISAAAMEETLFSEKVDALGSGCDNVLKDTPEWMNYDISNISPGPISYSPIQMSKSVLYQHELSDSTVATSKLSRRFNKAGLEQSKLSRHVAQHPNSLEIPQAKTTTSNNFVDDSVDKRLQDGDLTPPPGFGLARGECKAPLRHQSLVSSSLYCLDEDDDVIAPSELYRAAFANASMRRRASERAPMSTADLFKPSIIVDKENEEESLLRRRKERTGSITATTAQGDFSISNWRWFIGNESKTSLDARYFPVNFVPNSPQKTIQTADSHRTIVSPVGSGVRSAGRVTPIVEDEFESKFLSRANCIQPSTINLGIFDEF